MAGEMKPVPIWPGGSATAPSPGSSAAAPAPSTSSPLPFGMPAQRSSAAAIAPKPTPAAPTKPATPTGHPFDPWGQPWPGDAPTSVQTIPAGPGFPVAPQIGHRYRSGADTWILTPGGWRLMTSSRELPIAPPSSSSSASTGAFEAEKNALQAERDKHLEQGRKLVAIPMGPPDDPEPRTGAVDEQPEHKAEPKAEPKHSDAEHKPQHRRR
jgi:hypothetical protein